MFLFIIQQKYKDKVCDGIDCSNLDIDIEIER